MYEKKFLGFPLFVSLQTMQKTSAFFFFFPFFSGTDQWKKKAYKTFIDTITSTVTCHRTQTHGFTCTYRHSVGFHWGLPMNLCNLYRKTINARGRTEFGEHMGKNTTGLSHMKSPVEKKEV